MFCGLCKEETFSAIGYDGKLLCSSCYLRIRPAYLKLIIPWDSTQMINPEDDTYKIMSRYDLIECGFFLHQHIIYEDYCRNTKSCKEVLLFRYSKNVYCTQIRNHPWPRDISTCDQRRCRKKGVRNVRYL